MRYSRSLSHLALVALLASLFVVSPAHAAGSKWRGISVTLHDIMTDKVPTLVVYGSLAEDVELPTVVELPIPAGSEIGWVGEVFAQDPSLDKIAPFEVRKEDGFDVLVIEVTTAKAVQAELMPPAGWVERADDSSAISMSFTAVDAVPGVLLAIEVPSGYYAAALDPADAVREPRSAGTFYSVETSPVAEGDTLTLKADVVAGVDPALAAEADSGQPSATLQPVADTSQPAAENSGRLYAILGILVLLLGVASVLLFKQLRPNKS